MGYDTGMSDGNESTGPPESVLVEIKDVRKIFKYDGGVLEVLSDVNLQIERGEFICLIGPSGCGKSTLLNILGGFEKPDSGTVKINGRVVEQPVPRYITIFQNLNLLPWRNVLKNVELGLRVQKLQKTERRKIARKHIELAGLSGFERYYPHQLSGGMRQRAAIACALAVDPEIIFMDEPFGALDALSRLDMQNEILRIQKLKRKTIVFVTHDIEEAVFLANRVVVMTPKPCKIKSVISVPLPYPRERTSARFIKIRDSLFETL